MLEFREIESDCDDPECRDCQLTAVCEILGTLHHVTFVRVRRMKNESYDGQGPVGAAHWYDKLMAMDPGGNFQTVRVPGFKGRYVCIITPFQK